MPISSGILAPTRGASSSSSAVGRKLLLLGARHPPSSVAVAGRGVWRRGLAGVGVAAAAASSSSPDELHARGRPLRGGAYEERSALWNLIKDIEPLDLSIIQKDVPSETVDAMKRTVSGMLGLLPSDQFHVVIESLWNPFFKLLASSIMTGYTLFNAQYRLSLERTLEFSEEETECKKRDSCEEIHSVGRPSMFLSLPEDVGLTIESEMADEKLCGNMDGLGSLSIEAKKLILGMQSRLDSMEKELHELKKKNSSQQMQQFAGEEKNELLYYLRSLSPEKVVELSESSCPGVEEAVYSVVHGLLATLSPKMHTNRSPTSENMAGGAVNFGMEEDDEFTELVEDVSLPFQPLISIPRDRLARLLFWCMMLGHYIRGQECRLELMHLLAVSSDAHS
ncbi:uncharacterized LOC4352641 [Oryza sativa Japonica Group]|uniref:Os12g0581700 protein n=5 Tax=Oryza TaxID=4527 RepID=Q2QN28_ORYSJ|nr:uncharacterized LOC4352641 [Oryza sativa Japonica Group]EAY83667.1 hypothetical protein OsI_38892 [Oryza sativa Indica Group]KAB8117991.1 hypothetical protein EE612_060525 [Oryza sativa]ABA99136.2 seed maturation protein PM23, putative, expressed [Oryza sativa Japonica Group]EAZ21012.1 hypothetical protein OsJ_36662 [Oryza sativa Japonica Group]KAF2908520.1 hypothetical protein DAI22_12g190200 [Oryza sativa Japonica Group]|eukprot:NP_001067136.1 Os12g0581700 [Oryza sativa Japonica Group]